MRIQLPPPTVAPAGALVGAQVAPLTAANVGTTLAAATGVEATGVEAARVDDAGVSASRFGSDSPPEHAATNKPTPMTNRSLISSPPVNAFEVEPNA
jgi:hypothetical protein